MGALKLEVFHNGELVQEVPVDGKDLWVGRDDDCVIRLDDRAISRKHALLRTTDQGVQFEKKSKFGQVKVNGKESEQTILKGGDRLEFAQFEIRVKKVEEVETSALVAPAAVAAPARDNVSHTATIALPDEPATDGMNAMNEAPADAPSDFSIESGDGNHGGFETNHQENAGGFEAPEFNPEQATPMEAAGAHDGQFDFANDDAGGATRVFSRNQSSTVPVLQFGDGAANVTTYEITDDEVAIGRSQKCNVVLEDRKSSRKHSIIRRENGKFILKDLGSANGTLVNGERVDEHELQSGDVLTIGDTQFTFRLIQADYETKKADFIAVPQSEIPQAAPQAQGPMDGSYPMDPSQQPFQPGAPMANGLDFSESQPGAGATAAPAGDFSSVEPEKKTIIGKMLDRYRSMNTKQQIIYGVVFLGALYMLLDDDPAPQKAKLLNQPAKVVKKAEDKKPGSGMTFENLTPEQQRYVENQNQLALDYFKNRDYDSSLLEVEKIFSLVQDYKGARTIESLAREGKHRLEAQEEERKKKDQEKQAQIRLQELIEQARLHMEKKEYKEAEATFPDIEILQPENTAVSEWRKIIMGENDRKEREENEKRRIAAESKAQWSDYEKVMVLMKDKKYWDALDGFDALVAKSIIDSKLAENVKLGTKKAEDLIAADRDPLLAEGKQLEEEGKYTEAYRSYQKAYQVDPTDHSSIEGMARIRGNLNGRAKAIYAEGVFAESYGDMDAAERQYRQVLEVVPNDDDYYQKAQIRLKRLTVFRKPASETPQ